MIIFDVLVSTDDDNQIILSDAKYISDTDINRKQVDEQNRNGLKDIEIVDIDDKSTIASDYEDAIDITYRTKCDTIKYLYLYLESETAYKIVNENDKRFTNLLCVSHAKSNMHFNAFNTAKEEDYALAQTMKKFQNV